MFQLLVYIAFCLPAVISNMDIRIPPDITLGPPKDKIYRDSETIKLDCVASGDPHPWFEWKKDGQTLDPNDPTIRWVQPPVTGSIEILNANRARTGYYQCLARNAHGTAMSNVSFLQMASLDRFSAPDPLLYHRVEGENLVLPCASLNSVPTATYSWALAQSTEDKNPVLFIENDRVRIDESGNLHFSYLKKEDEYGRKLYKCQVFNSVLDITQGGSYANISITANQPIPTSKPLAAFATATPLIGVTGGSVKMTCLFYGNPVPKLSWKKSTGALPPPPRWMIDASSHSTEVTIYNLEKGDAGDYICTGQNKDGSASSTITLLVEAQPVFVFGSNHLSSRNITEGDTATFTCASNATPAAAIIWYRNGDRLDKNSLPAKYQLSGDDLNLTISQLCKTCSDGPSSLVVIQCNASNVHGYAFAQGSINVIEKTIISSTSVETIWMPNAKYEFPCRASSDDLTPLSHSWFLNNLPLVIDVNDSSIHFDTAQQTLYINTANDAYEDARLTGMYRCVVTNGYSNASVQHVLASETTVVQASSMWWIPLVIALILLIIILILVIYICIQRNKGDSYSVDKKERWTGNDPEKELNQDGFHNYQRGDDSKPILGTNSSSKGSFADLASEADDSILES